MKPISTEQFIQKATKVHGDRYDYSRVVYEGRNTPVEIICSIHGEFFQKPTYHILRKSGCPKCYRDSQKYTEELFLKKAKAKFGNQFSYGVYTGFRNPIEIICKDHGSFTSIPSTHLIQNGGCKQCLSESMCLPHQTWIDRFNQVHNNKYDYNETEQIRSGKKMNVGCSDHGLFYPTPENHIRGHGCPTCACLYDYVGGYCEDFFILKPHKKTEIGIFYTIRLWDDKEEFYKVGITNRSVELRFKSVLPYQYEIVNETKTTLYEAHLMEKDVLEKHTRYVPNKRFSGWTECFVFNKV